MVSNNTLASLVVIAIIVAVAGIVTTLNTLSQVGMTGAATGTANVTVLSFTSLSIIVDNVNFGSMNPWESNDTADSSPPPFELRNDGNVDLNVTVNSTSLWTVLPGNVTSVYFQGKCRDNEATACGAGSNTTYGNIPIDSAAVNFITNMPFPSSRDEVYFDINVTVPEEETPGAKSAVITFTGTQA